MVIAPGKDGISAFVILADGEKLPENLNSVKTLVLRRGESTGFELQIVKRFGYLAEPELVRKPAERQCNHGKLVEGGFQDPLDPLHQHADGTWWFYEETWSLEHGPYEDKVSASSALVDYCQALDAAELPGALEKAEAEAAMENEGGPSADTSEV